MSVEQLRYYQEKLSYEIDAWDLYEALSRDEPFVVVDGRAAEAFALSHVPNAINLPHREICATSTSHLDKSKIYVCYCDGIGCNASTKTALKLVTLGFKVKELIGGLDWWKRDGYATEGTQATAGKAITCGC